MPLRHALPLVLIGLLVFAVSGVTAQEGGPAALEAPLALPGTGFTYQGSLSSGGAPVTAVCDFQFNLWDAASSGTQLGSLQTKTNVAVAAGRFTVVLNESGQFEPRAFDGSARWLAIAVRCPAGGGGYTNLSPRQPLTPAPLAFALPGLRTEQHATSPNVIGGHISNTVGVGVFGATIGGGGEEQYGHNVLGDYGTVGGGLDHTVGGDYGTVGGGVENSALTTYDTVGGGIGNTASGSRATVGGGDGNFAFNYGAVVAGGVGNGATGFAAAVGGGQGNDATGTYATVGGGTGNTAGGENSTVGGGTGNTIPVTGTYATIGGGDGNTVSGVRATVGGGGSNTIPATGTYATIGGGGGNTASILYATVGGGQNNTASNASTTVGGGDGNTASGGDATVGGGQTNTASAGWSTVVGGRQNTASGGYATVGGGFGNTALGAYSFAAGYNARALHDGAWVWADGTNNIITSTTTHQFLVRASGGITVYTNVTATTGVRVFPGSGTWTSVSDRNAKANFAPVDGVAVLDALMGIPIETWNYHTQDAAIRHMGPMAQDFYAAFGLGETDTGITTVDADGVALAALQGLYTVVQEKDAEIAALKAAQAETNARLAALEQGAAAAAPANGAAQLTLVLVAGLLAGAMIGAGAFALSRSQPR